MSKYEQLYRAKYDRRPEDLNRASDNWSFQDMIEDLGYGRCLEVIEYYMDLNLHGHPVKKLLSSYHHYDRLMADFAEDEKKRAEIREQTRRLVEESERNGDVRG